MKNLFEQLTDKSKAKFDEFPHENVKENLRLRLEKIHSYIDLDYSTISLMSSLFMIEDDQVCNIWKCFDI